MELFASNRPLHTEKTPCLILGVLAGIIPATIAAKMDPVVAIRTK